VVSPPKIFLTAAVSIAVNGQRELTPIENILPQSAGKRKKRTRRRRRKKRTKKKARKKRRKTRRRRRKNKY